MGFVRRAHRGCNTCGSEISTIKEFIQSNQISFGKTSYIAEEWLKQIDRKLKFKPR